ncbi:MAG: hypothetical protein HY813_01790 [Candidatus Portnoybacteria bacterium]|nr:hypothetical protein [Candidatus Portnoybacteria bacterium]
MNHKAKPPFSAAFVLPKDNSKLLTGFTLTELLVYLAVFVIILAVVVSFLFWAVNSNNFARASIEVQDNVRKALERMTYEIRSASGVYVPTSAFNSPGSQLSLATTLDLPAGETITYEDFYLDNGKLFLKKEGSRAEQITSDKVTITSLDFKYLTSTTTAESIQIGLTVDYNNPSADPYLQAESNSTTTATLREY